MLTLDLKNVEAVQRRSKKTRGIGNSLCEEMTKGIRFIYLLQKREYLGRLHYLNIGHTLRGKKVSDLFPTQGSYSHSGNVLWRE